MVNTKELMMLMKHCTIINRFKNEDGEKIFILKKGKKEYIAIRKGKCQPKKCKSACCKFIHFKQWNTYAKGFGQTAKDGERIINCKCKYLKKNRCTIWNRKQFPKACTDFPVPGDGVYAELMDKCTFSFDIKEVKDIG